MSDKFFVGLDLTSVEDNGLQRPISRVTLLVDDENSITAGDDTGIELLADCPHATQAMVNAILAQVKGYQYRMFSADDAALDPSAELGDGVTAGGLYSVISRLDDDGSGYSCITAPGEEELEDEFPIGGFLTKEFNRKIAQTRSQILKTAEEITASVETVSGELSKLKIYVGGIELSVENGEISSTIKLKSGDIEIGSQEIKMTGLVTITGLSGGTTTIDGACIKTGLISADRLELTGAITFGDLNAATQTVINNASSNASYAVNAANAAQSTVNGWSYTGTTFIDGSKIMTGTVAASKLIGGTVQLVSSTNDVVGGIDIANTDTGYGLDISTNTLAGGIRMSTYLSDVYIAAYIREAYGSWFESAAVHLNAFNMRVQITGDLIPNSNNRYTCGSSGFTWSDVYADNGSIVTSDREKKKDISYSLVAYGALFDKLRPVSYKLKDGQSGRTHLGLIAQDVEQALEECGLTGMDFAGLIKTPVKEEDGDEMELHWDYALRYGEFIPMCIAKIQELTAQVAELKRRLAA